MKYYRYVPDADHFAGIGFEPATGDAIIAIRNVTYPLIDSWTPPVAYGFDDNPPKSGDFPSLSNFDEIPVMSDRAWKCLLPVIGYCCEALPFLHPSGEPFWIIHVMDIIDGLDAEKAQFRRNRATGRINDIELYSFKEHRLDGKHIFKLPRESGGELLVDDIFRNAVARHRLKGLIFRELPTT